MIIFTKVRYQNFLATGNAPIEIPLNTEPSTLIVGINGAGKSTMSEAICFALFGRPLRNINKPLLVNSVNGRECLVELEFTTQGTSYKIRRGIKPNVFEIYANGTLLPLPASLSDYQTLLETTILKLNFKSFIQVVVLGGTSYVPFMRLSAAARREVIEDLLDIEVFSSMNALAKEDLVNLKAELEKNAALRKVKSEQVKMAQSFTEHIEEQRTHLVANVESAIATTQKTITDLNEQRDVLLSKCSGYDVVRAAFDVARTKVADYEKTLFAIQSREKKLRKERTFYEENDTCPTCEQPITEDFKYGRYATLEKKEKDAAEAIQKCQSLITKYQQQIDGHRVTLDEADTVLRAVNAIDAKLPLHKKRIKELEEEKQRYLTTVQQPQTVDVDALQRELTDLAKKYDEFSKQRVIMDAAAMLLKDNGIKTRIIRHYLPIINKQINHYLNALDFPVLFTLDEEFREIIKSRHRDEFQYESFSDGEKKRIDLALLLTWRAVAKLKNSSNTNLLILDEVFDSSLDANGTEEFLKIINTLEHGETNVFVISHKTDQLVDKFSNVIVFEKNRGFSQIKK